MAMEKLYELHAEGGYDLVVVDTPPTRNALDFLDAPRRLTRFLDNRIFRLLMMPTRAYLRAVSLATQTFLRTISKVVGGDVVRDAVAFFNAMEGDGDAGPLTSLVANLQDLEGIAEREESYFATLVERVKPAPVARVPFLAGDVHDIDGLDEVRESLLTG